MFHERARSVAASLLLVAIGLGVYGFSLHLPLFLDDILHLRWLDHTDLRTVLTSPGWLSYYRPLPNALWKVLSLALGTHHAPALHALNLALHLLNAVLLLWLVRLWRGPGSLAYGAAAATLFLLFPFSYQAVPWASAVTHPLATALALGSLLLMLGGRDRSSRPLLAASLGLALLSPFAHETGAIVAPLVVMLLWTASRPVRLRQALTFALPYALAAGFGTAVLLLMRQSPLGNQMFNLESRWQNTAYYMQALAYPISPLAKLLLSARWGLNDLWSVVAISAPAIAVLTALYAAVGRGRPAALALAWFAMAAAPSWLMLGFEYVIDGPRLLYAASVGAALFWALPADLPWRTPRGRVIGGAAAAVVIAATAASGYAFILSRSVIYQQLKRATDQLIAAVGPPSSDRLVLALNFPSWLAPLDTTYAVGHEGVPIVASYFSMGDYYQANAGRPQRIDGYVLPDVQRPWRFHYVGWGPVVSSDGIQELLRSASRIIVTSYESPEILVYDAGALEAENASTDAGFLSTYDDNLALLSYELEKRPGRLLVTLLWQSRGPLARETTTFLHMHDQQGDLVAQTDGLPVGNVSRPSWWKRGDVWRDTRVLPLPEDLKPGRYLLRVGAYPVAGGPRLAARTADGQRAENDSVPLAAVDLP